MSHSFTRRNSLCQKQYNAFYWRIQGCICTFFQKYHVIKTFFEIKIPSVSSEILYAGLHRIAWLIVYEMQAELSHLLLHLYVRDPVLKKLFGSHSEAFSRVKPDGIALRLDVDLRGMKSLADQDTQPQQSFG